MLQTYEIQMDDGSSYTIEADARDIRAWEAEHSESFLNTVLSFTVVAQIAYLAGKRTGILNGQYPTYAEFDSHCVDARGKRDRALVGNPTQKDRTEGSSATSPSGSVRSRRK